MMGFDLRFSDKEITAWGAMAVMKRLLEHHGDNRYRCDELSVQWR